MFFIKNDNVITVKYQTKQNQTQISSNSSKTSLKKKKVDVEGLRALKSDPGIMIMEVIV